MLSTQTSPEGLAAASRTKPASYSMTSKAGKNTVHRTVAGAIAEYKRNTCAAMGLGIGPRLHGEVPYAVTYGSFSPKLCQSV